MHIFNWCINFKIRYIFFNFWIFIRLSTVNKHETHSTQTPLFSVNYIKCVSHILLLHCTNLLTHVDITHTCHFAKIFRLFSMGRKNLLFFGAERRPDIQSAGCQRFSNHSNTYISTFTPSDVLNNVWQTVSFSHSPRSVRLWTLSENF